MKIVRNLVGISALCLLLSSCGGGDPTDSCGGSLPKQQVYLITGYNTSLVHYDKPIETVIPQLPKPLANNESPAWNAFSLELNAAYQSYQAKALPRLQFSLFAQAMHARLRFLPANKNSPKYPLPARIITAISIPQGVSLLMCLSL